METIYEYFGSDQIIILILASIAIWGLGSKERVYRLVGSISGFICEPIWFYVSYQDKNGGIMVLTFVFLLGYARAIKNNMRASDG